jgi:protein involved in polysaccharide export with SLBB domain
MTGVRCLLAAAVLATSSVAGAQPAAVTVRTAVDTAAALRPGDVVRLRIWREPDLSGEFAVDEAGVVVLPKVGPIQVTSEDPRTLKTRLVKAYEAYLNQVSIDVVLLRRVQVLGAVRSPGLYQVDPTMVLSDLLALAGGSTSQGNLKGVQLLRDGRKVRDALSPNDPLGTASIRSGDQIYVPEKGWLSRNPWFIRTMIGTAISVGFFIARSRN